MRCSPPPNNSLCTLKQLYNNLFLTRYKKSKRSINKRTKTNTTQNRKNKKLKQTSKASVLGQILISRQGYFASKLCELRPNIRETLNRYEAPIPIPWRQIQ